MASEQFSLCWDNFHKNMSSGMNSLLENEDLVDVTLAVEGKYLKAHKMVLSVCSPYFKELFKTNPCKHPIVFMKDVSYVALSDLLQFMYQGEVQVSQENLTTFIKTAEALQIKGLTGDGNGSTENEVDHEKSVQQLVDDYKPEYKPSPSVPRPKKLPASAPALSAPKRQRLSTSNSEVVIPSNIVTKTEPVSNTPSEVVQFKMEPYDQTQSISIQDDDEQFGGESLDDTAGDDTEDYSMMEGNEEEPQAGTSAEGSGEGQARRNIEQEVVQLHVKLDKLLKEFGKIQKTSIPGIIEEEVAEELFNLPVSSVQELNEFETKLGDKQFFTKLAQQYKNEYVNSRYDGRRVAYLLIEQLIKRRVLTHYSWTGISKSNNKLCFADLENVNKFFYHIVKSADKEYSQMNHECFFKNAILKYSEVRAKPKAAGKRTSTPRTSIKKSERRNLNLDDWGEPQTDVIVELNMNYDESTGFQNVDERTQNE